jgi:hypothetical protein
LSATYVANEGAEMGDERRTQQGVG